MKRSRLLLQGICFLGAVGMLSLAPRVEAQGIYVGPGGISFGTRAGSYYLPFGNIDPYYRGRNYGTRGSVARSYIGAGPYWAPGMSWAPLNYWYGDLGWPRYINTLTRVGGSKHPHGWTYGQYVDPSNLPPVPEFEELQRMNWTHLRRVLAFGSMELDQQLNGLETGAKWSGYLRVKHIEEMAANHVNLPPTRDESEELKALLSKFDQTAEDKQYSAISGLWGFETTRRALAAFLQNPASRYRQQLVRNSADLDRALERFGTGATWRQYLSLPTDLFVDQADAEAANNPPDPGALRRTLAKFDDVAKNPAYRMITDLPAFEAAHTSLERYLGREMSGNSQAANIYNTPTQPTGPELNDPGNGTTETLPDPTEPDAKPGDVPEENPTEKPAPPSDDTEELFSPPKDETKPAPAVREKE